MFRPVYLRFLFWQSVFLTVCWKAWAKVLRSGLRPGLSSLPRPDCFTGPTSAGLESPALGKTNFVSSRSAQTEVSLNGRRGPPHLPRKEVQGTVLCRNSKQIFWRGVGSGPGKVEWHFGLLAAKPNKRLGEIFLLPRIFLFRFHHYQPPGLARFFNLIVWANTEGKLAGNHIFGQTGGVGAFGASRGAISVLPGVAPWKQFSLPDEKSFPSLRLPSAFPDPKAFRRGGIESIKRSRFAGTSRAPARLILGGEFWGSQVTRGKLLGKVLLKDGRECEIRGKLDQTFLEIRESKRKRIKIHLWIGGPWSRLSFSCWGTFKNENLLWGARFGKIYHSWVFEFSGCFSWGPFPAGEAWEGTGPG